MRGSFDLRVSPTELYVGMVVARFGDLADLVDESECLGKISKFELPLELVVVKFPTIKPFKGDIHFFFG